MTGAVSKLIQNVLDKLSGVTKSGNGFQALCPGHDDSNPSLHIEQGNDGRVLLKCHAGCVLEEIISPIGLSKKDLFPLPSTPSNSKQNTITLEELASKFQLPVKCLEDGFGFHEHLNGIRFPFVDYDGRINVVNQIRTQASPGRTHWDPKGMGEHIVPFGRGQRDINDTSLVLVEGVSDVVTMHYHGLKNVLGVPGNTMHGKLKFEDIKEVERVFIIEEQDGGGGKVFVDNVGKRLSQLGFEGKALRVILPTKDVNDLHKLNSEKFNDSFSTALSDATTIALPLLEDEEEKTILFPCTDLGNSERLIHHHGADIRFCTVWGKWLIWDGKRWKVDDTNRIFHLAKEVVRDIYNETAAIVDADQRAKHAKHAHTSESNARLSAMVDLTSKAIEAQVTPQQLDADPMLFNVENGTVDLQTGKLLPHVRENLISKIANVKYESAATCPRFLQFQSEIFSGDTDLTDYKQRLAGYQLTGLTIEQQFCIEFGDGANGKSTDEQLKLALLGDYAMQTPPETLMTRRPSGINNDIARLRGARFVVAMESSSDHQLNESLVKQMTGGDTITARYLFGEFFEFKPEFKITLATNHRPKITGIDHAIWRRIHFVPYMVSFSEEQQDKRLLEKLLDERSGILNWMIQGCLKWQSNGLNPPDTVVQAVAAYRAEEDVFGRFLEEMCVIGPDYDELSNELFNTYEQWRFINNEEQFSKTKFGRVLTERGFVSARNSYGLTIRKGLKLKSGDDLKPFENPPNSSTKKQTLRSPESVSGTSLSVRKDENLEGLVPTPFNLRKVEHQIRGD